MEWRESCTALSAILVESILHIFLSFHVFFIWVCSPLFCVLCAQCCRRLWIVNSWLRLWFSNIYMTLRIIWFVYWLEQNSSKIKNFSLVMISICLFVIPHCDMCGVSFNCHSFTNTDNNLPLNFTNIELIYEYILLMHTHHMNIVSVWLFDHVESVV